MAVTLAADDFLDLAVDQTTRTLSGFAVPSGSDRLLVAKVAFRDASLRSVSSVTYGGVSMTRAGGAGAGGQYVADFWYLVAPTVGSGDVVVTFSGLVFRSAVFVEAYAGVHQSTPIDATGGAATGTGTSFAPSTTVATSGAALSSVAWSNIGSSGASALTASSPATAINYAGESQNTDAAGSAWNSSVSTGSQSISWATTGSEPYSAFTVALRPAGGTVTPAPFPRGIARGIGRGVGLRAA